ncbi:MAG TPA: bifunctional glutamate N-acetyltransferase/amino-acid acetyltransferase ArgJ [Candidatus Acidoferrales bacterium]|nr:bifunctional glutamate N-acetyltransferase/amino-acid acetyltransferase ArgJ [Candidatus Acidoferrales bacterium]
MIGTEPASGRVSRSVLPHGFRFAATACGLKKKNRLDLALISTDLAAAGAGVFTTNLVQAAPVVLSSAHLRASAGDLRAIVVNSGNANCATGSAGMAAARRTATAAARELGCRPQQVLVCSTGVIGVPLPVERILGALPGLARARRASASAFSALTRAIMTTDTRPKWAAASCRIDGKRVRLLGCAKGAGMIHPQMATMLAFVLTDVKAPPRLLEQALRHVTRRTFNAITVDGDTSTNDTLLLLASGASGSRPLAAAGRDDRRFVAALEQVCRALALQIVADGEGASRVVQIEVRGTASDRAAEQVARTIAGSPLVKTALAGADPNWGRILAAAGRAGVSFDPDRAEIRLAGLPVCRRGRAYPFSERMAHRRLLRNYVPIVVDLKHGKGRAHVWTCDFTADYIEINASYRT